MHSEYAANRLYLAANVTFENINGDITVFAFDKPYSQVG